MVDNSFGSKLRGLRHRRKLTGLRLSKALGISVPYLSQLESGRAIPSEQLARRIAGYFGQEENELLFLARRVPATLGAVLQEFPTLAPQYFGGIAARKPTVTNQRRDLMVRIFGASEETNQLTNYSVPASVLGSAGLHPPLTTLGSSLEDTFESVRPGVVALASRFKATQPGNTPLFPEIIGTGFVVDSSGIVVTNRHVVDVLQSLPPNPATGARSDMAIVWSNVESVGEGHAMPLLFVDVKAYSVIQSFSTVGPFYGQTVPDLAFIQLNVRDLPALSLAAEPNTLRAGLNVATAGFPLGTDPLVMYGHVTQLTPFLRQGIVSSVYPFPCPNPHGFTLDIASQPGSSGSPVFLSDRPEVVGIIHAGIEGTNVTVAIPSLLIRDALNACTNGSPLDLEGVPTLRSLLDQSERTTELRWQSFMASRPTNS
jgi:S1-C subfamily serine protease